LFEVRKAILGICVPPSGQSVWRNTYCCRMRKKKLAQTLMPSWY
jgi:hypothetical protein